jgi:hypothetical protein
MMTVFPRRGRPNAWNAEILGRGTICGAEGYCQYGCPPGSAIAYDANGVPADCVCLPNFRSNEEGSECVWSEEVECSVLSRPGEPNACDACNSESLFEGCSTGRFECLITTDTYEGECIEWASMEELEACIQGGVGYDCDPACYEQCANANCSPCCTQTDESPDPGSCP